MAKQSTKKWAAFTRKWVIIFCPTSHHRADTDKQAEKIFSRLVKQLAEKENVMEKLKAENQMLWVQKMY